MKTTTKNFSCDRVSLRSIVAAAAFALPWVAGAHDLVLVPEPTGSLTVRFGHPGDWQPTTRERLVDLKVEVDSGPGKPLAAAAMVGRGLDLEAQDVAPRGKPALVTARYDNGLWVSVADAAGKPVYYNTSKALLPQGGSSMSAIKFAKALYGSPDDAALYKREVNHLVELIPQRNPATVKPGETLAVQVKFNGKPLPGAGVEITDTATTTAEGQPKFTTNAAGIAEIPIRRSGFNMISVDVDKPNDGSLGAAMKALPVDKIAMIATYAFQVR